MFGRLILWVSVGLVSMGFCHAREGHWDQIRRHINGPKPPMIRVLIAKDCPGVNVEVQGRYDLWDPYDGSGLGARFVAKSARLEAVNDGIKWGEVFPGVYQIAIVPDRLETITMVNGIPYRGSITVYHVENTLNIVNETLVEDYVQSILSSQFESSLPTETLAALAIAARTDACTTAMKSRNPYYDVVGQEVGYNGYTVLRADNHLAKAMQGSKNMVLSRTRAFSGSITPFYTHVLDKEYGAGETASSWSLDKATQLAKEGQNACKILASFFSDSTIEIMETYPNTTTTDNVAASQ